MEKIKQISNKWTLETLRGVMNDSSTKQERCIKPNPFSSREEVKALNNNNLWIKVIFLVVCCCFLISGSIASALDIVVEPAKAQREIGQKVRVHFYANNASDLISMGIKITFNAAVLQVDGAGKYEDVANGWLMDADGDPTTTGDQYNNPAVEIDNTGGTVKMIGGHLNGPSPTGLSGKVLLGWIVFTAIANGDSPINVDLGEYHPLDPTYLFDNFVCLDGTVDEPTNVPGDLGIICVMSGACIGDIMGNGTVDMGDFSMIRASMGTSYPNPAYNVACDLNANGSVDMGDFSILRSQMGKTCPSCALPL